MKLRIQDNSVRFRISKEELAKLNETGRIESVTELYKGNGEECTGRFLYAVSVLAQGKSSDCFIQPTTMEFHVSRDDLDRLSENGCEGIHLCREAVLGNGAAHKFNARLEIDLPPKR